MKQEKLKVLLNSIILTDTAIGKCNNNNLQPSNTVSHNYVYVHGYS